MPTLYGHKLEVRRIIILRNYENLVDNNNCKFFISYGKKMLLMQ